MLYILDKVNSPKAALHDELEMITLSSVMRTLA